MKPDDLLIPVEENVLVPTSKEIIDAFQAKPDLVMEVNWKALNKDLDAVYMSLKQHIRSNQLPLTVHKKEQQLLLRKKKEEQ